MTKVPLNHLLGTGLVSHQFHPPCFSDVDTDAQVCQLAVKALQLVGDSQVCKVQGHLDSALVDAVCHQ